MPRCIGSIAICYDSDTFTYIGNEVNAWQKSLKKSQKSAAGREKIEVTDMGLAWNLFRRLDRSHSEKEGNVHRLVASLETIPDLLCDRSWGLTSDQYQDVNINIKNRGNIPIQVRN